MPATEAGLFEARLTDTRLSRSLREVTPQVIVTSGEASELQPPGSVCILAAPRDSELLARLHEAIAEGDKGAIEEIIGANNKTLQSKEPLDLVTLSDVVDHTPAFVDVSYAGKTVIDTVFPTDDFPIARAVLPYAGGVLDPEAFAVVEYVRDDEGLDVLVVVHEPEPNEVVDRILGRLPADADALRVGQVGSEAACTATATPVVVAVTVAIVGTLATSCAPKWNDQEFAINPAIELAELAPELGVRQLIAMRQQRIGQSL